MHSHWLYTRQTRTRSNKLSYYPDKSRSAVRDEWRGGVRAHETRMRQKIFRSESRNGAGQREICQFLARKLMRLPFYFPRLDDLRTSAGPGVGMPSSSPS
jgi:hypothetical protein